MQTGGDVLKITGGSVGQRGSLDPGSHTGA